MTTANGTYGCTYVQNIFPPTQQSIDAWIRCIGGDCGCVIPPNTGLPSNTGVSTSRGDSTRGSGIGGGMMIGILLLGLMTLNT
jgi:hypothetical protein